MTNLNHMRLPHHKTYNWCIVFRQGRVAPKARLVVVAVMIELMLCAGKGWLTEINNRIAAEQAHISLKADVLRLANFGRLTMTDYREGTTDIQVRRPK